MSSPLRERKVGIDALLRYPERIDVRSPAEFALDHLPGAANHPVLDNAQRAQVGTLHAQVDAFAARRVGAALVARNIAAMIETAFAAKPRHWAPLVYCWRGGKRSEALVHILNEVGWNAVQLEGGYRSYRRHVVNALAELPGRYRFAVVCGLTGSGKSRLLAALAAEGAQVLDLEAVAQHRGSLLGELPGHSQPGQKAFETQVLAVLQSCDPARPVYVEAESRRVGLLQLPDALLAAMRAGACIRIDTPLPLRLALLKQEYAHFIADPATLTERLASLTPLYGKRRLDAWQRAAGTGDWDSLIADLLLRHYDPRYTQSIAANFPKFARAVTIAPTALDAATLRDLARALDAQVRASWQVCWEPGAALAA